MSMDATSDEQEQVLDLQTKHRRALQIPVCIVGVTSALWSRFDMATSNCVNHIFGTNLLTDYNAGTLSVLSLFALTLAVLLNTEGGMRNPLLTEIDQWAGIGRGRPKAGADERGALDYVLTLVHWLLRVALLFMSWYFLEAESGHSDTGAVLVDSTGANMTATIINVLDNTGTTCTAGGILSPYHAFMVLYVCLWIITMYEAIAGVAVVVRYSVGRRYDVDNGVACNPGLDLSSGPQFGTLAVVFDSIEGLYSVGFLVVAVFSFMLAWASMDTSHYCTGQIAEHSQITLVLSICLLYTSDAADE